MDRTSSNSNSNNSWFRVNLARSAERVQQGAWEQILFSRQRRLQWLQDRDSIADRRQLWTEQQIQHEKRLTNTFNNWRPVRDLAGTTVASVALQNNCHQTLFTGEIQIGSPPQVFQVDFDTTQADLWVVSADCRDEYCQAASHKFQASESTTYEAASSDVNELFYNATQDGIHYLTGVNGRDVVQLGPDPASPLRIPHQVFAHITSLPNQQQACQDGTLGLGHSLHSRQGYQTIMGHLNMQLRQPIFSLYTTSAVDANTNTNNDPTAAGSQIVFGGVDQQHYQDCLVWHDIGQLQESDGEIFRAYWDLVLDGGRIGSQELADTNLAILDNGSYYLTGPAKAISTIALSNQLTCFQLDDQGQPEAVDCAHEDGFDIAAIDCEQDLQPLTFYVGRESYVIDKHDLVMEIVSPTSGVMCLLRLLSKPDSDGWIFGDVFLNRYYAVFDFGAKRIGLATSSPHNQEICPDDWPLDIAYDGNPYVTRPPGVPVPGDQNEAAPPHASPPAPAPVSPALSPTNPSAPPPPLGGSNHGEGLSWGLVLAALAVGTVWICYCKRKQRRLMRQRAREQYSVASRYEDKDADSPFGDMELT